MSRLLAVLLLATGCRCDPPRIVGGSADTRVALWQGVDAFFTALDPELRVCVPQIRVKRKEFKREGKGAHYNPATRGIRASDWPHHGFTMATHELCHALAAQNPGAVALRADEHLWTLAGDSEHDRWYARHEAFAGTCEVGALAARILARSCPQDTDGAEAFAAVAAHFPGPIRPLHLRPYAWVEVGSFAHGLPRAAELEVVPLSGGVAAFQVRGGSQTAELSLDLWTGQPAPLTLPAPTTAPPVAPPGLRMHPRAWARADDADLLVVSARAANGGRARRLLIVERASEEDDGVVAHAGCVRLLERPFAVDGTLWSAWVDGERVRWGQWVPR